MAAYRLPLYSLSLKGQINSPILSCCLLSKISGAVTHHVPAAYMSTKKHYDPKWRTHRRNKIFKLKDTLPNFDYFRADDRKSLDEKRTDMKKDGKLPRMALDKDRPIQVRSSDEIFEGYKPKVNDGKSMFFGMFGSNEGKSDSMMVDHVTPKTDEEKKQGVKDKVLKLVVDPYTSFRCHRIIKKYEAGYNRTELAYNLQDLYMEALKCLEDVKKNEDRLFDLITDKAYLNLTEGLDKKTVRWEFIESLEPPKFMKARVANIIFDANYYAQITIRMHTRQKLAIYDRFGRLMYGHENLIKDVLEYVVFEKHIVDVYGKWRIHGKIEPNWREGFVDEALITTVREPAQKEPEQKDET